MRRRASNNNGAAPNCGDGGNVHNIVLLKRCCCCMTGILALRRTADGKALTAAVDNVTASWQRLLAYTPCHLRLLMKGGRERV